MVERDRATLGDVGSVQLTVAPAQAGLQPDPPLPVRPRRPARRHRRERHPRAEPARPPTSGRSPARRCAPGPAHFQLDGDDLAVGGTVDHRGAGARSIASPRRPGPSTSRSPDERAALIAATRHDRAMARPPPRSPSPSAWSWSPRPRPRPTRPGRATSAPRSPASCRRSTACTAEIRGGDSFLEVTVDEGHTVIVEGYQGEPYLRFQPDGTVERNRLSTATYLNDDRKGKVDHPAPTVTGGRTPTPTPEWEQIADRRHLRLARPPRALDGRRLAERRPRRARSRARTTRGRCRSSSTAPPPRSQGTLVYEESVSPAPLPRRWPSSSPACSAFYGRRARAARRRRRCSPSSSLAGDRRSAGPTSRPRPTAAATRCTGALAARRARHRRRRRRPRQAAASASCSRSPVGGLAVGLGAVPHPGPLQAGPARPTCPTPLDRTVVALALGVSVGAAVRRRAGQRPRPPRASPTTTPTRLADGEITTSRSS